MPTGGLACLQDTQQLSRAPDAQTQHAAHTTSYSKTALGVRRDGCEPDKEPGSGRAFAPKGVRSRELRTA